MLNYANGNKNRRVIVIALLRKESIKKKFAFLLKLFWIIFLVFLLKWVFRRWKSNYLSATLFLAHIKKKSFNLLKSITEKRTRFKQHVPFKEEALNNNNNNKQQSNSCYNSRFCPKELGTIHFTTICYVELQKQH